MPRWVVVTVAALLCVGCGGDSEEDAPFANIAKVSAWSGIGLELLDEASPARQDWIESTGKAPLVPVSGFVGDYALTESTFDGHEAWLYRETDKREVKVPLCVYVWDDEYEPDVGDYEFAVEECP